MVRRNLVIFVILILLINGTFGVYLLGQRRATGSRSDYYSNLSFFGSVLEMVHDRYVDPDDVDYEELTQAALQGMLRALDPHSELLVQSKYEDLQSQTRQEFGGIGIQIERRDERITVIAPIAGTPGERAGIMPGDQIISVDGINTEDAAIDKIVELLRGAPGEKVELTLHRPQTGEVLEKTIVREVIQIDSVRNAHLIDGQIGYVQITQFGDRTGSELVAALDSLEEQGMRGLIIDLRNNPGGLLTASVEVAQPFFNRNELVVYTQGRDESSRFEIRAERNSKERNYPIAVLINSGSASASEIVAGALQDTKRAVIVGETSFGKGSVQSIYPLRNESALRLTTAKYYTPSGKVIHERGVIPDIVVELPLEDEVKLRVQRNRPGLKDPEEFLLRFGFEPIEDRQLQAAIQALEGIFLVADQQAQAEVMAATGGEIDDSRN
ncbi:MAG TPA: S41 family peptidase [Opitutales bacterium]|nr:S41 family peptidase [Opitutales bacterium]